MHFTARQLLAEDFGAFRRREKLMHKITCGPTRQLEDHSSAYVDGAVASVSHSQDGRSVEAAILWDKGAISVMEREDELWMCASLWCDMLGRRCDIKAELSRRLPWQHEGQ